MYWIEKFNSFYHQHSYCRITQRVDVERSSTSRPVTEETMECGGGSIELKASHDVLAHKKVLKKDQYKIVLPLFIMYKW